MDGWRYWPLLGQVRTGRSYSFASVPAAKPRLYSGSYYAMGTRNLADVYKRNELQRLNWRMDVRDHEMPTQRQNMQRGAICFKGCKPHTARTTPTMFNVASRSVNAG